MRSEKQVINRSELSIGILDKTLAPSDQTLLGFSQPSQLALEVICDQVRLEANRLRVEQNKGLYRRRQAIVEHPFGTIKRGWGYSYTLLRRIYKVTGAFSLIFTTYNMRRSVSILAVAGLLNARRSWKPDMEWVKKALLELLRGILTVSAVIIPDLKINIDGKLLFCSAAPLALK